MPQRSVILGYVRLAALYLFVAALVLLSRPTPALVAIGALFVIAGEAIRIWAAGHLVKSAELITWGPYARTQNPLYLGRLLILTGIGIAARIGPYYNLVVLAIGYAVFFFYYIPRKLRVEGGRLARLHGPAFEQYHRSVPILFPSARPYPGPGRPWSSSRMVLNQEPAVVVALLLILGLLAYRSAGG